MSQSVRSIIYVYLEIFYNDGEVMNMLVAYNEKKEAIILFQLIPQHDVQKLKAHSYYCPQCGESVIMKVGPIKIPHFAHKRQTACDRLFTERESVAHLSGKQQLYCWLQAKKVPVQLEATIPKLLQRPDLLAVVQKKRYAIEFQCSPISEQLFYERTAGYLSHGIHPIWILNNFPQTSARKVAPIQALKLTYFQQLFIQQNGQYYYIVCYDVDSQQFVYYHHLFFIRTNHYVAAVSTLPLMAQRLPLLQPTTISKQTFQQLFGLFRNRQQAYIDSSFAFGQAKVHDLLWRSMYELRILYDQIPFTVGLPIVGSEFVCESTLKWQVALHYYTQRYQMPLSNMTESDVERFLRWANFANSEQSIDAVLKYLRICQQMKVETVHSAVSVRDLIDCLYNQFVAISVKN